MGDLTGQKKRESRSSKSSKKGSQKAGLEIMLQEHTATPLDMDRQDTLPASANPRAAQEIELGAPLNGSDQGAGGVPANRQERRQMRMMQNMQARQMESIRRRQQATNHVDQLGQHVRDQLLDMKTYTPWFTYVTAFIQIVVLTCSMLSITGGTVGPWGFSYDQEFIEVPVFDGSTQTQEVRTPHNLWYGPTTYGLLHWGVKYTPCMRQEDSIQEEIADIAARESDFGCCRKLDGDCGMMTFSNCTDISGATFNTSPCTDFSSCDGTKTIIRPCCFGVRAECQLLTSQHCEVIDGFFHEDAITCSEVNCLEDICNVSEFSKDNKPDQWWRLISPIFMHIGVAHLIFNLMFQIKVVAEIEAFAGPWRVGLMYMASGIGGNIIGSIFSPNSISAGSSGSLYGMIGVMTVDLFQSWQLIQDKASQLIRLIVMLIVVLGIGTLPWIDNWAHAGGFFVGVICGIAFLPYIYFGKWDERRKFILRIVAMVALVLGAIIGITLFYEAPDPEFCSWCHYINCIPYTSDLCREDDHNQ